MKKIITILAVAILGISAYAKTADELYSENAAILAKGTLISTLVERQNYVLENEADIKAALETWKSSYWALHTFGEDDGKTKLTEAERNIILSQRFLFGLLYKLDDTVVLPDAVAVRLNQKIFYDRKLIENPSFYTELKEAKWKIDDVEIPLVCQFWLASYAEDFATIESITPSQAVKGGIISPWLKKIRAGLLSNSDTKAAYDKTVKIENALLSYSTASEADIKLVQNLQDTLYLRITRANKLQ